MPLVLSIAGLLDRALAQDAPPGTPALARLLRHARAVRLEPQGRAAAIAPHFGVERQRDWPIAPLRVAASGIDTGSRYWLRATPVALVAGRDDVRLQCAIADLEPAETHAMLASLNAHFAADDLHFIAPQPHDWFVGCGRSAVIRTHALEPVIGQRLRAHLPSGEDAATWLRWEQEIEMLLHQHPVNAQRDLAGKMPVSGVWLQHGGVLPTAPPVGPPTWTDDPDVAALAKHAHSSLHGLPSSMRVEETRDSALVIALAAPAPLEAIETHYAQPAWSALAAGRLDAVEIIADGLGRPAVIWSTGRPGWLERLRAGKGTSVAQSVQRALSRDRQA